MAFALPERVTAKVNPRGMLAEGPRGWRGELFPGRCWSQGVREKRCPGASLTSPRPKDYSGRRETEVAAPRAGGDTHTNTRTHTEPCSLTPWQSARHKQSVFTGAPSSGPPIRGVGDASESTWVTSLLCRWHGDPPARVTVRRRWTAGGEGSPAALPAAHLSGCQRSLEASLGLGDFGAPAGGGCTHSEPASTLGPLT